MYDFIWVQDHNRALCFKTQEQADLTMMAIRQLNGDLFAFAATLGEASAVEHGWLSTKAVEETTPTEPATESKRSSQTTISASKEPSTGEMEK